MHNCLYDFEFVEKLSCKILRQYKNTLLLFRTVAYCSQSSLVAATVRLLFCITFYQLVTSIKYDDGVWYTEVHGSFSDLVCFCSYLHLYVYDLVLGNQPM